VTPGAEGAVSVGAVQPKELVLTGRDRLEVVRVHAPLVSTFVVNGHPHWDFAHMDFIRDAMCKAGFPVLPYSAVTILEKRAAPPPASGGTLLDFLKKSHHYLVVSGGGTQGHPR
jgi:hypothetical protein